VDWGALYAHIATTTGWTYGEIDGLTLPQVVELKTYWRENPPVHQLVAAYMGYKPPADPGQEQSGEGMAELMRMFPTQRVKK
jgi:hypothetical protein